MGGTAFLYLPAPHERVPYRALLACNHDGWLARRTVAPAQPGTNETLPRPERLSIPRSSQRMGRPNHLGARPA